ncbi:hypothetical protein Vafri_6177 [Volvox africanus]|uniref:Ankyrin repeat protein n=1 Tax=Volvox africanus TaxID=51714 RepID=A0A8J4EVN5_9CHLO|nr:hypothetical protein Vafri_6177 [Volvox africanus]
MSSHTASCADVSTIFTIRQLASGILCAAAMAGHEHVVATALVLGASGLEKALVDASGAGRGRIVRLLLACGADPNAAIDSFGPSALFKAASNGHTDVVQLLLDAGACIDSTCITVPQYNDRVAATVLRFDAPAAAGRNRSPPAYVWGQWPAMLSLDSHRRVGATTLAGGCGSSSGVFPPLRLPAPMPGSTVALGPPLPLPRFPPLSALSAPQLELQTPCGAGAGAVYVADAEMNQRMSGTLGALLTSAPSSTTAATATAIPLPGATTVKKMPASATAPFIAVDSLQRATATEADADAPTILSKTTSAAISSGLRLAVSTTVTSAADAVSVIQTPSSSAGDVTPALTVPTTSTTAALPSLTSGCDSDEFDLAFGGGTSTSSPRTPVRSTAERALPPPPPCHRKSPGLLPTQMPSLPLMPPLPKLPPLPNSSLPQLPPGATMSLLGPRSRFNRKTSLLLVACQGGHAAAAALLIRYGAKVDREGGSELVQAGHPHVVDELLAAVPDLRVHLDQALVASASDNRLAVASALLRHGADPSYGGGLALQEAAFMGHTAVLKLLLESGGALLRTSGVLKSVLEMARKWCRPGVVQMLADAASATTT